MRGNRAEGREAERDWIKKESGFVTFARKTANGLDRESETTPSEQLSRDLINAALAEGRLDLAYVVAVGAGVCHLGFGRTLALCVDDILTQIGETITKKIEPVIPNDARNGGEG